MDGRWPHEPLQNEARIGASIHAFCEIFSSSSGFRGNRQFRNIKENQFATFRICIPGVRAPLIRLVRDDLPRLRRRGNTLSLRDILIGSIRDLRTQEQDQYPKHRTVNTNDRTRHPSGFG